MMFSLERMLQLARTMSKEELTEHMKAEFAKLSPEERKTFVKSLCGTVDGLCTQAGIALGDQVMREHPEWGNAQQQASDLVARLRNKET